MSRYPIPEVKPRMRRQLIDFMSASDLETLKSAPQDPNRPKGKK
jgi:hypothetical protein